MSLLIAYLGVSKVNLAYERYMTAQISTGHALMILRELNQLALTLTENCSGEEADEWRSTTHQSIIQLIHETVATLRDGSHAALLARNVDRMNSNLGATAVTGLDDPMVLIHALRSHLYHDSMILSNKADEQLQLLERCKMVDLLHEFVMSYRNLLRIASTPLPFALVQMKVSYNPICSIRRRLLATVSICFFLCDFIDLWFFGSRVCEQDAVESIWR